MTYTFQRRERDSNPRYLSVQRFSRPPHSTTLPSLQNFFERSALFQKRCKDTTLFLIRNSLMHFFLKKTLLVHKKLAYKYHIF